LVELRKRIDDRLSEYHLAKPTRLAFAGTNVRQADSDSRAERTTGLPKAKPFFYQQLSTTFSLESP
jgi:hypothetical protein